VSKKATLSKAEIMELRAEKDALLAQTIRLTEEYTAGAIDRATYEHAVRPGVRRFQRDRAQAGQDPRRSLAALCQLCRPFRWHNWHNAISADPGSSATPAPLRTDHAGAWMKTAREGAGNTFPSGPSSYRW